MTSKQGNIIHTNKEWDSIKKSLTFSKEVLELLIAPSEDMFIAADNILKIEGCFNDVDRDTVKKIFKAMIAAAVPDKDE